MKQKILILDDDFYAAAGIATFLQVYFDVQISCNVGDLAGLLDSVAFDLVILDLDLKEQGYGLDLVATIQAAGPKVLVLTTLVDKETMLGCTRAGVNGYVRKSEQPEGLLEKVRGALAGHLVTEPSLLADMLAPENQLPNLGWREIELIDLTIENPNVTLEELAEKIILSKGRIKNIFQTLYRKFNVHKRGQLLVELKRLGYRPHIDE